MTNFNFLLTGLISLQILLVGCTGSMEDLASLKKSKGVDSGADSTTPSPANGDGTPGGAGDSGGGDTGSGDSGAGGNGDGSSGGNSGDGSGAASPAPEISILNINSPYMRGGVEQQILFRVTSRVGAVSRVEYIVSCPSAGATPENSITSGTSPNSPSAVTIQDNIVSVGAGEDTAITWQTPSLAEVKCRKVDSTLENALNSFKIKITTVGENNQSVSAESNSFQIDSEAPVIPTNSISCANDICIKGGVTQIGFTGLNDNLTPVDSICLKMDDSQAPAIDHPCWRTLASLGASISSPYSEKLPGPFTLQYFLGFLTFSSDFFFWIKDGAGNISQLSNNNIGTTSQDKLTITTAGTSKIANSDATFMSSSKGLFYDASASEVLGFSAEPVGAYKFAESAISYTSTAPDNFSLSLDPLGQVFIRDASKGLLKLVTSTLEESPNTNIKSVAIPQTGTFNPGPLSSGSVSFKALKKHAIDSKGVHWFLDDNKLSYVDFTSAEPTLIHVAGGGTDEISDDFLDPKTLKINSNVNIDAYGVFIVLPNQWVVFSADDPMKPLNPTSGARFKLRVYKHNSDPSKRTVATIYLSDSNSQGSVNSMIPYGVLAVNYDSVRNNVKHIAGRFCDIIPGSGGSDDSCSSAKLIRFSVSTATAPEILGSTSKDTFMSFKYQDDTLYMSDATKGTLNIWNSNSFQKVAGSNERATSYCNNMSVSTACPLRLVDFYPIPNGRDQVLLRDHKSLRILEQGEIFSIYSAQE